MALHRVPGWNRPIKVIDATSFRTPDTHANQKRYHYPTGQKKDCGFPVMRALAIFSLASGAISQIVTAVCYAGEMPMLKALWRTLLHSRLLDILVADALPVRPGRSEPRAVKKRPKPYPLLTKPRHIFKELAHKGKTATKRPQIILT